MNLVKKLFKADSNHRSKNELANPGWSKGQRHRDLDFHRDVERMWSDIGHDPWSIVRDPWTTLDRMSERFNELENWPAIDISEDEHAMHVRCDVPGLDAKELDVQVSGNVLTVSGSRDDEWKSKKHGVHHRERVSGRFARAVTLPSHVDGSQVEAKYEKGTLTITVPRIPGKGPRRVQVKAF